MGVLNLCVIGVGGVGGYFGGKLAHAVSSNSEGSTKVFFVARSKHLEAIQRDGLTLLSPEFGRRVCKPALATETIADLPEIDVFLISVKGYDLMEVAASIKDRIRRDTVILPLLNGADIHERLRHSIHTGIILPACIYVSSHIEGPGVVAQIGMPGRIVFGRDEQHPDYLPREILKAFEEAAIIYEWKQDANPAIWEKYVFIASFGLVSARYNRSLGEILDEPSLKEKVVGIMKEIQSIAMERKIRLPEGIVDLSLKLAARFPRDTQTSLQRDVHEKKGKSELDIFGGTIVDLGEKLGVPTPITKKIYGELKGS